MENYEIEIKIPVKEPEEIMKHLLDRGFNRLSVVREDDMYYNSEYHDVRKRDEALRIRKTSNLSTGESYSQINFKGKKIDQISMSRSEYETGIEDPEQAHEILTALGFSAAAGVRKIRQYLKKAEMTVCLDQVDGLGNFLEMEVIVKNQDLRENCLQEMKNLLDDLGLSMENTVRTSYLGMLMKKKQNTAADVEAVITSYNQGTMILEAVESLCGQTVLPAGIVIVDDGSTDEESISILEKIESSQNIPVPVTVIRQHNKGVSAARNTGIRRTKAPFVMILDGDDKVEASYIEKVRQLLYENPSMIAASSWMHTFGALDSTVCPEGGNIRGFLSHNCCPATHICRREVWQKSGGYDESMKSGFEDWDYFLSILETMDKAYIGIVPEPLINYRTAPASSNVRSMTKRLELMRFMIKKHRISYQQYVEDAILGVEEISMSRLYAWESEIACSLSCGNSLSQESWNFIQRPSYGDGGMAAAVRIVSGQKLYCKEDITNVATEPDW